MLDALVACLEQVGLKLNASKTKVLTTQAQPPSTLTTPAGLELAVLEPTNSHKWLGCLPVAILAQAILAQGSKQIGFADLWNEL